MVIFLLRLRPVAGRSAEIEHRRAGRWLFRSTPGELLPKQPGRDEADKQKLEDNCGDQGGRSRGEEDDVRDSLPSLRCEFLQQGCQEMTTVQRSDRHPIEESPKDIDEDEVAYDEASQIRIRPEWQSDHPHQTPKDETGRRPGSSDQGSAAGTDVLIGNGPRRQAANCVQLDRDIRAE